MVTLLASYVLRSTGSQWKEFKNFCTDGTKEVIPFHEQKKSGGKCFPNYDHCSRALHSTHFKIIVTD